MDMCGLQNDELSRRIAQLESATKPAGSKVWLDRDDEDDDLQLDQVRSAQHGSRSNLHMHHLCMGLCHACSMLV